MKTATLAALLAALALQAGCRERERSATPTWLDDRIGAILAEPVTNPPTRIFRYRYRGEVVYYRPPHCCDVPGVLFDAGGRPMCRPDGGITGQGDGRCADFAAARRDCALVWSDPRAKPATHAGCDQPSPGLPEY